VPTGQSLAQGRRVPYDAPVPALKRQPADVVHHELLVEPRQHGRHELDEGAVLHVHKRRKDGVHLAPESLVPHRTHLLQPELGEEEALHNLVLGLRPLSIEDVRQRRRGVGGQDQRSLTASAKWSDVAAAHVVLPTPPFPRNKRMPTPDTPSPFMAASSINC